MKFDNILFHIWNFHNCCIEYYYNMGLPARTSRGCFIYNYNNNFDFLTIYYYNNK